MVVEDKRLLEERLENILDLKNKEVVHVLDKLNIALKEKRVIKNDFVKKVEGLKISTTT